MSIVEIRPYHSPDPGKGAIFIKFSAAPFCSTDILMIDLSQGGSEQTFAVAMMAMALNKPVLVEMDNGGCVNPSYATRIQSLYLDR